jgi:hypothetical protein
MSPDRERLLNLRRLPVYFSREDAAHYYGRELHEIEVLEKAGFFKPCGHPPPNGKIMYSSAALAQLAQDTKALDRMADAIYRHWRDKNLRRKKKNGQAPGAADGA